MACAMNVREVVSFELFFPPGRLTALLTERGKDPDQLIEVLGITPTYYQGIDTEMKAVPVPYAEKIASFLEIPLNEFIPVQAA